jgi:hypothetical protein
MNNLRSGNACCQSVEKPLPSLLLAKSVKIKIYKNIIFLLVLYARETWSLRFKEEARIDNVQGKGAG